MNEKKLREIVSNGFNFLLSLEYPTRDIVTPLAEYFENKYGFSKEVSNGLAVDICFEAIHYKPKLLHDTIDQKRDVGFLPLDLNGQLDKKVNDSFLNLAEKMFNPLLPDLPYLHKLRERVQ